jgi:hypothetical protein
LTKLKNIFTIFRHEDEVGQVRPSLEGINP